MITHFWVSYSLGGLLLTETPRYGGAFSKCSVSSIFHPFGLTLVLILSFTSRSLQQLQANIHWFCDREDGILNHNTTGLNNRKTSETEISSLYRRSIILESLKLFAYDSPEIAPQKNALARGIDRNLEKCDVCIVEYYKLKRRLIEKLRE